MECAFPGPSVYAKRARGMMCRFIVEKQAEPGFFDGAGGTLGGLRRFVGYGEDAYHWSEAQSTDAKLVFLRGAGASAGASGSKSTGKKGTKRKR